MLISFRKSHVKKSPFSNIAKTILRKYSPDQERDWHGRFGSGGGAGVVFEVAPNPDDKGAMTRWDRLSDSEKFQRSQDVANKFIPSILADRGIKGGTVQVQCGSYLNDTNTSFNLELPEGSDPSSIVEATKGIGFNFSQQSMIAINDKPFPGSSEVDAIEISSPKDYSLQDVKSVYAGLRDIEVGGVKAVGGATTVGNKMAVLNFDKVMSTPDLAKAVQDKIKSMTTEPGWEVHVYPVHSWFATEADYGGGKASVSSTGGHTGEHVPQTPSDFRAAVTAAVTKTLQWLIGTQTQQNWTLEKAISFLKGGPGSGRYPAGSGQPKELIAPAKVSLEASKTTLAKDGPYGNLANAPWYSTTPGKDVVGSQVKQVIEMAKQEKDWVIDPALEKFNMELEKHGIFLASKIESRPKDIDSTLKKMNSNDRFQNRTLAQLTDAVGTRMVFQNNEDMEKAIPLLKTMGMPVLEHDDFMEQGKSGGYRGQHFLLKTPNGVVFELQMRSKTQDIFAHYSHPIYKHNHAFAGVTGADHDEAQHYATKVGDWLHNPVGPKPEAPDWMVKKGLEFPWHKVA